MLRVHLALLVAAGGLMSHSGGPNAQTVSEGVLEAMSGDWLVAPDDGRPGCHLKLGVEAAIGGYGIELAPGCGKALPQIADAAAWRLGSDGGLAFANALRKTILTFVESEDATYATAAEPGKRLLLVKAPDGVNAVTNARDVFGNWSVAGTAGKSVCNVIFSDRPPPGGEESYALSLQGTCEPRLAQSKLVSWRVEGLALMLYGTDGDSLTFEPDGKGGFVEQPRDDGRMLRLVRRQP